MLEKIRKINLKTAVFMGICFYSLTMLLHVLIISGVIPFTWVNGGRSDAFTTQLPISIFNIIICIIGGVFTLVVAGNTLYKHKRGRTVICWFFVALWSFGFCQQLLGTPLEKLVGSLLLLLGVISNLRMAIEKR
ncbi:hypothetical protein QNH48_14085 [Neobacillus sp. YX16]|uniref:hypothetical protein n=1 Tax=Neobacillus sp. YX16 TaxID=3047874 RepID=UPI0024C2E439|nr:hypothetical protein [Neobacillus sp. YX16]WHZ05684.1 hypothetical protein QNH48_14085 [Neobacillus sp. YX16]